ncbi:MAG: hypothetical protein CL536_02470 [Alcaligenaceae bacterium]|nr:hypothetical protein [Alcaligenaceae bacterium]
MSWWDSMPQATPLDIALSQEKVDPKLAQIAQSVYQQESSGGKNTTTSNAGAVGGMQIIPSTFQSVADADWDINDPVHNARAGIRYLNQMYEMGGNDPRMAAIGYYGGPGAIEAAREGRARSDPRNPNAPDTFEYADQVTGRLNPQPVQASSNWWESMPLAEQEQPQESAEGGGILAGIGMGLRDPIDAGAQMLRRAVPEGVGRTVDEFGNMLSDWGLPVSKSNGVEGIDKAINEREQQYQTARAAAGREGFDWARLGGNIAGTAPLMAAAPASLATAALPTRIAAGGVQGAALGAANPVIGEDAQQNFGGEKLGQVGVGAAFGGATPVLTGAIGRLISPLASRANSPAQTLSREGVQLTPGQALGGALMRMEDRAMSAPILGDAIRGARSRANESLNRAVYNRVLEPIGKSTTKTGREAVDDAAKMISQAYDDVLGKVSFRPDNGFSQSIANIRNMASSLPSKEAKSFNNVLQKEVIEPLTKSRAVDGMTFKRIESQLGERAQGFLRATDAYQNDVGRALLEVQKALRENLARMNPAYANELQNVNRSFAQLVRLENAAGKIGAQEGVFTPQQLAQAIRQTDRSSRKRAYSSGRALMQDLSDAAQSRMSAKIPDSGTAERLMLNVGAVGSGVYSPLIPAGLAVASVPYLPGISRLATRSITGRPEKAQVLADQLRKLPPGFLGALAQ